MKLIQEVTIPNSKNEYLVEVAIKEKFATELAKWENQIANLKPRRVLGFRIQMGAMNDWVENLSHIGQDDRKLLVEKGYAQLKGNELLVNLEEGEAIEWEGSWGKSRIIGECGFVNPKIPPKPELPYIPEHKTWLNRHSAKDYFKKNLGIEINNPYYEPSTDTDSQEYFVAYQDTKKVHSIHKWFASPLVDGYLWCIRITYQMLVYHLYDDKLQVFATEGKSKEIFNPSYQPRIIGDDYNPQTSFDSDGFWNK